jgi:kynurenine formamidase
LEQPGRDELIKKLSDLLGEAIPLHLCPLRATVVRGMRRAFLLREQYGTAFDPHSQLYTSAFFSLHGTTHTDLPFALNWENLQMILDPSTEYKQAIRDLYKRRTEIMKKYYTPRLLPCVVLDLKKKFDAVYSKREIPPDPIIKSDTIDLSGNAFGQLHKDLEISTEDLEPVAGEIDGRIVLFRTGWELFQNGESYDHPRWEAWSLYLTHPYLGQDGIDFLLKHKVEGIGSDAPDLEDPLLYVFRNKSRQDHLTRHVLREADLPRWRPVHVSFLREGKWLIQGLVNMTSIPCEHNKAARGSLLICPFPIGSEDREELRIDDSMPLTIYYFPI